MERNVSSILVATLALLVLAAGFSFNVGTQKTDKKADHEAQVTYVNTDSGIIRCLGEERETPGDHLSAHNPSNGDALAGASPGLGQTVDTTEPKHSNNICLGGAVFDATLALERANVGDTLKLWAQEEAHHQTGGTSCEASGGDKVFCPSGFTSIQSTYTYTQDPAPAGPQCLPGNAGPWTEDGTNVCQNIGQDAETYQWIRTTHKTAICNDANIQLENTLSPPEADPDKVKHTILWFLSGTDATLDCHGIAGHSVTDLQNLIVDTVNTITCSEDPDDPGEELPNVICITPSHPAQSSCDERAETVGTVGTISYDVATTGNEDFCDEDVTHDDPFRVQDVQTFTVKNVPLTFE